MMDRRRFLRRQGAAAPDLAMERLSGQTGAGGERGDFENASGKFQVSDSE